MSETTLRCAVFLAVGAAGLFAASSVYLWLHPRDGKTATATAPEVPKVALAPVPTSEPALVPVQLTPERMQSIGVKTGIVAYKTLRDEIRATGDVEVDETKLTWVQVRFSGWIQQVFADSVYQKVAQGQRLFTIYSPEVAATEREYLLAKENDGLLGNSTVPGVAAGSMSLLNAATERLRQWQIPARDILQLESGGAAPKEIEIDSPASGVVTERNAFASAYVQPGTKIYTIADLSRVWVYAQVLESDIARVQVGDSAAITTDALPGRTFSGRVSFIQPQFDQTTRSAKVRIEISNEAMRLSPGMFVSVSLAASLGRQLTIPASGVFQSGTRQIAFVDRGSGYFEPREIETDAQAGDDLVVLKGLKSGDKIVTSANFLIDSESQLQAAMGSFAPPPPGAGAAAAINAAAAGYTIEYSTTPAPPRPGGNVFRVKLSASGGMPVTGAQVTVTYFMAAMPAMGMAAMRTVSTLTDKGGGIYEGPGNIQMSGTWQVTVLATKSGQTLAQKQLDVSAGGK